METLPRDVTKSSELFSKEDVSFMKMISSLSTNLEEILTRTDASFCCIVNFHHYITTTNSRNPTKWKCSSFPSVLGLKHMGCLKRTSAPARKKGALGTTPDLTSSCISVQQNDGHQNSPKNLLHMRDFNRIKKPEFPKLLV